MRTGEEKLNGDIKKAFEAATPNVLDSVLSSLDSERGKVVSMNTDTNTKTKKARPRIVGIIAAAAAFMLILGAVLAVATLNKTGDKVFATVLLDVNPSIGLEVNKQEKVIRVDALNEDAKIIIGDMDFEGSSIDVAVNALIGSMLRKGYLSDIANSILITVDNADARKAAELQKRLASEIESVLAHSVGGAVISQTVEHSAEVSKEADEYGVSVGKAQLINSIIKQTAQRYTFEDLVALNINELNLLMGKEGRTAESDGPIYEGAPSENAYIGRDRAIEIALEYANISRSAVIGNIICEFEYEHNRMVYEVEFSTADAEYDADIDAVTGAVTDFEVDKHFGAPITNPPAPNPPVTNSPAPNPPVTNPPAPNPPVTNPPAPNYIGEAAAKRIAFERAGVAESQVRQLKIKLDTENGVKVYDVEFKANGYEYDIEINALTGAVMKFEKEIDDDANPTPAPTQPPVSTNYITAAEAKAIALKKAGVTASEIRNFEIEFDKENGVYVYEIEFEAKGYEYDITVNAKTGAVIKFEREVDTDSAPNPTQAPVSTNYITAEQAKAIALKKAGVTASEVRDFEIEFDKENGVYVYEIGFDAKGYEYDITVNAKTGTVIKFEREADTDSAPNPTQPPAGNGLITAAEAKAIALKRAGLTAAQITAFEIELDKDDGMYVYEVEFKANGREYSVEINAKTGAVIDFDID
ncbi:MAG: PepSY domain-containing protein [Clostridia bacterium]|nr:PepSY domain-containing protein [Clostridia bacterium]